MFLVNNFVVWGDETKGYGLAIATEYEIKKSGTTKTICGKVIQVKQPQTLLGISLELVEQT